jgi:hypothetical protein
MNDLIAISKLKNRDGSFSNINSRVGKVEKHCRVRTKYGLHTCLKISPATHQQQSSLPNTAHNRKLLSRILLLIHLGNCGRSGISRAIGEGVAIGCIISCHFKGHTLVRCAFCRRNSSFDLVRVPPPSTLTLPYLTLPAHWASQPFCDAVCR